LHFQSEPPGADVQTAQDLSGNLIVQLGLATEKLNGAVVSKAPRRGGISCGVVQPPLDPFFCCRFRNRMPGPPPFSSMNSTPAVNPKGL